MTYLCRIVALCIVCSITQLSSNTIKIYAAGKILTNPKAILLNQQKKMSRLQQGVTSQQELIRLSQAKGESLLTELEKIDQKLANERNKLSDLNLQLKKQEKEIRQKRDEINLLSNKKDKRQKQVIKRLSAYYKMGTTGLLNVTFARESLPELLQFNDFYGAMLHQDKILMNDYRQTLEGLNTAVNSMQQQKAILTGLLGQAAAQEVKLSAARTERSTLLSRVRTEKKLYERALNEIQGAAGKLTDTIAVIKKQTEQSRLIQSQKKPVKKVPAQKKVKKQVTSLRFAVQQGNLKPPVQGQVTTLFGSNKTGKFGISLVADGINIKAPSGSAIRAIYHGVVAYVGEMRGYGNILIIDHGDQYYSLVSRADKFYPKKGERVVTREVIGITNGQSGLLAEGIHFEIRHGTKPLDPLTWLNTSELKLNTAKKNQ